MIGKIIAAAIGRNIDRRDGDSGMKGAAIGLITAGILRRAAPIGVLLGTAYIAKRTLERRKAHLHPID